VYRCDPGEELPPGRPVGRPLSWWRTKAGGPGKPIVIPQSPYSPLASVTPATITVPEFVLEGLPEDALLRFTWGFGPKNPSPTKEVQKG